MHIAIPLSDNKGLESSISSVFARCPFYMLIDPEDKIFSIEENPAQNASGGAGVQAAQWMVDKEVAAVIVGNLGPKAHDVLSAAKISAFKHKSGSIEETIEAYKNKELESFFEPNVDAHAGIQK
ncbi:MAG: NifB/NifX family molybdenum-iron cluster-binding protein [Anaerolineaceae bacterium]|nr:NifB/NifX family molybdenum-iron cluster-binding protein [Anaerolineaceae bacterium]